MQWVANPASLVRMASRTVERAFPSILFPCLRVTGFGVVFPEANAPDGAERAGFSQTFGAGTQEVMFHGPVL